MDEMEGRCCPRPGKRGPRGRGGVWAFELVAHRIVGSKVVKGGFQPRRESALGFFTWWEKGRHGFKSGGLCVSVCIHQARGWEGEHALFATELVRVS